MGLNAAKPVSGPTTLINPLLIPTPFPSCNNSSWDKKTGPNAPLYDMDGGGPGFSIHSCVENWKAGGGLPDQM